MAAKASPVFLRPPCHRGTGGCAASGTLSPISAEAFRGECGSVLLRGHRLLCSSAQASLARPGISAGNLLGEGGDQAVMPPYLRAPQEGLERLCGVPRHACHMPSQPPPGNFEIPRSRSALRRRGSVFARARCERCRVCPQDNAVLCPAQGCQANRPLRENFREGDGTPFGP